jgi:hypothetical protein
MASSVLAGKGPLLGDYPPWHRMPGYGYFIALAGHGNDLFRMGLNAILLQVGFKALAIGYFFLAAVRIMRPAAAVFIATIVLILPSLIYRVMIESIIPAIVKDQCGVCDYFSDAPGSGRPHAAPLSPPVAR